MYSPVYEKIKGGVSFNEIGYVTGFDGLCHKIIELRFSLSMAFVVLTLSIEIIYALTNIRHTYINFNIHPTIDDDIQASLYRLF